MSGGDVLDSQGGTSPTEVDRDFTSWLESCKATTEWSKQVATLASVYIALSASLVQVFQNALISKDFLSLSWYLMSASVFAGILFMGTAVHQLSIANVRRFASKWGLAFALIQFGTFLAGLASFIYFAQDNL